VGVYTSDVNRPLAAVDDCRQAAVHAMELDLSKATVDLDLV
jgi:hypothetical protein